MLAMLLVVTLLPRPDGGVSFAIGSHVVVREAPSADAGVVTKLSMNQPVAVVGADDAGWTPVQLGQSRGYAASHLLGPAPLRAEECLQRARASQGLEKVTWLERAAAIEPSRLTLSELTRAVRETGDEQRAAKIEAALAWPSDIWLSPDRLVKNHRVHLEGRTQFMATELDAGQLSQEGIAVGDRWWLLPAEGAAFEGRVVGASMQLVNECGGEYALWVELEVPEEAVVVAGTPRRKPPASWRRALTLSKRDSLERLARTALRRAGEKPPHDLTLVADAEGRAMARAQWSPEPNEPSDPERLSTPPAPLRDVFIGRGEPTVTERFTEAFDPKPIVRRDVDGDGVVDLVTDACATRVETEGWVRKETAVSCCE